MLARRPDLLLINKKKKELGFCNTSGSQSKNIGKQKKKKKKKKKKDKYLV